MPGSSCADVRHSVSSASVTRLPIIGLELVSEDERADAVVINTCSFLESACEEAIEVILECSNQKRHGEVGAVLVAGCLPNRYGTQLAELMPEIDGIISPGEYDKVADFVKGASKGKSRS